MITLTIGTNKSEPNVINKDITWLNSFTITSRDDISTIAPVIMIESYNVNSSVVNYALVQSGTSGTRYYFVTNVVRLTGGRTEIHLRCDVLETHKAKIMAMLIVADRASAQYNQYVADSAQRLTSRPQIQYKEFEGGEIDSTSVSSTSKCILVRSVAK